MQTSDSNHTPPTPEEPWARISKHRFLEGLKPEHLAKLAECSLPVQFSADQLIFREGDPANRFYLIRQGKVALEATTGEADPVAIQTIGPGDVLGWSWLFPPYYWHFDARALTPVSADFFYGTRLREECQEDPVLGYELLTRISGVMLQRLQATRRQLLAASSLALRSQKVGLRAIARKHLTKRPPAACLEEACPPQEKKKKG